MKRLLSVALMVATICHLFLFSSCANNSVSSTSSTTSKTSEQTLNWTLYATQISEDGEVLDKFQFTVTGTVPVNQDMHRSQALTLDIVWPDTFRFVGIGPVTYNGWASSSHETDYFYFLRSYSQYPSGKETVHGRFGIAPKKGYMLFIWEDDKTCLVASTDPNTSPEDIKSFFANMLPGEQIQ